MSNSLRDQLLKKGLVSKEKAKTAEQNSKSKYHQQRKKKKKDRGKQVLDSAATLAVKAREEEIQRAQELNRQKETERQQKALQAQIRDLILRHKVNEPKAEMTYNFTDGKFVRQIQVTSKQQEQLAIGYLAITVLGESYYLVPTPIAEKINERVPQVVIYLNKTNNDENNTDDPYADYQVPDDLMW